MADTQTATLTIDDLLAGGTIPINPARACIVEKGKRGRRKEGEEENGTTKRYGMAHAMRSDESGVAFLVHFDNGERIFSPLHQVKWSDKKGGQQVVK